MLGDHSHLASCMTRYPLELASQGASFITRAETLVTYDFIYAYSHCSTSRAQAFHQGLRWPGVRPDLVDSVRKIPAVLIVAPDTHGVQGPPGWRPHQLSGDKAGTWSIPVSGNWRMAFAVESGEIFRLDLEDYH